LLVVLLHWLAFSGRCTQSVVRSDPSHPHFLSKEPAVPNIEISYTVKVVAFIVILVVAYFTDSTGIKSFVADFLKASWGGSKPDKPYKPALSIQSEAVSEDIDAAIRILVADAVERECDDSIMQLNEYIALRNSSLLAARKVN
jgi:hypothetical protein